LPERLVEEELDPARKLWPEDWLNRFREAIKQCDISYKEIASGYMKTLCVYDYSYFRMLRKHFGDQKALKMYSETWLGNIPDYVDQAKQVYGLQDPMDLSGFGYLVKYAFNQQGCRFDITECRGGRLVAYITNCILTEYRSQRFPPEGDAMYQKSVLQMHNALIGKLAEATKLAERIDYTFEEAKLVISLR